MEDLSEITDGVEDRESPRKESAVDEDLGDFFRVRLACMCFTVWYTITWIVVLSTQQNLMDCIEKIIFLKDWFKCNTEEKDVNDSWTVFEFMSTGVAETATLAHLLLTLPAKAGGAEAVLHFRAYMVVFIIGTAVLYSMFALRGSDNPWSSGGTVESNQPSDGIAGAWWDVGLYIGINLMKLMLVGELYRVAAKRLRARDGRQARTAGYLRDLLKIFGVQVTLFVAMVAQRADSMPPISRLMAATTISQALPETFLLVVCMRDVIKLNPQSLAKLKLSAMQVASFACLGLFSLFVLYVYLVELQSENMSAETNRSNRRLYWISKGLFLSSAALILHQILSQPPGGIAPSAKPAAYGYAHDGGGSVLTAVACTAVAASSMSAANKGHVAV